MSTPRERFVEAIGILLEHRRDIHPCSVCSREIRKAAKAFQDEQCEQNDTDAICYINTEQNFEDSGLGLPSKGAIAKQHELCRAAILKEISGE